MATTVSPTRSCVLCCLEGARAGTTQCFQRRSHPVFQQPRTSAKLRSTPCILDPCVLMPNSGAKLCPPGWLGKASRQSSGEGIAVPSTWNAPCPPPPRGPTGFPPSLPSGLYSNVTYQRGRPQPAHKIALSHSLSVPAARSPTRHSLFILPPPCPRV